MAAINKFSNILFYQLLNARYIVVYRCICSSYFVIICFHDFLNDLDGKHILKKSLTYFCIPFRLLYASLVVVCI